MKKGILIIILGLFMLLLPDKESHAYFKKLSISETDSVSFTASEFAVDAYEIKKDGDWADFSDAYSTDEKVATLFVTEDSIIIEPQGPGSCTVTIIDINNKKKTINVKITNSYLVKAIKSVTYLDYNWYGSRKLEVHTYNGASVILKIRNDTYKFTLNNNNNSKKIKLKRLYKLNDKITITVIKEDVKVSIKAWFISETHSYSIKGSGRKLKIKVISPHKGDIIKVKHRGKTYKKKITKNYSNSKVFTIKTKKTVRKNGDNITVIIVNKYKERLDKIKFTLTKGEDDIRRIYDIYD